MTDTLVDVRSRIEALAADRGRYRLVGARDGVSPVPADGLRFRTPERAIRAARLTEAYRERLRRWDERTSTVPVAVVREPVAGIERTGDGAPLDPAAGATTARDRLRT